MNIDIGIEASKRHAETNVGQEHRRTLTAPAWWPGWCPSPRGQTLAVFGFSMVACLGVNDAIKVAMIKWRVPTAALLR